MRLLFITDIHGNCDAMLQLFDFANVDPSQDLLVVGGDMIDRGPASGHVLKGLKLFQEMYPDNVTILIGNHEQMMLDFYFKNDPMWKTYGGNESITSFAQVFNANELSEFLSWTDQLPIVFETDKYVFTHAGINPDLPLDKQDREVLWMNQKEFNTKVNILQLQQLMKGRIIVHGHTPGSAVTYNGVRLNCDLGSGVFPSSYAALALVDLTNDKYYRYSFKNNKITVHHVNFQAQAE